MYLQSGEWVIFLKVKFKIKDKVLKSLRFQIVVLLILVSSIPCFVVKEMILQKYEDRAVSWRTAEIQNQCTILCNQLGSSNYLKEPISEVINAELSQLSSVYDGRIMVIDEEYHIVKDTFGIEAGKTIIAPDVITCFSGTATSYYDAQNRYMEFTTPIVEKIDGKNHVKGVVLFNISTDVIHETLGELEAKANLVFSALMLIVVVAGLFVANLMVKPFEKIAHSIEDITEGYDSDKLNVRDYKETLAISEAFNKMRDRMKVLDD